MILYQQQHRLFKKRLPHLLVAATIIVTYGCRLNGNATDVSEAVLSCEEAFARLEECCPGFVAASESQDRCLDLEYSRTYEGCDGQIHKEEGHTQPRYSLMSSQRVRAASCEDLIKGGECEAAIDLPERGWSKSQTCTKEGSCYP